MARKRYSPEKIITKLREAEVHLTQGKIERYHRSMKSGLFNPRFSGQLNPLLTLAAQLLLPLGVGASYCCFCGILQPPTLSRCVG